MDDSIVYEFAHIPPGILRSLQTKMHIPADGVYGSVTENALVQLKRDRKIPGGNSLTQTDIDSILKEPESRVNINQIRTLCGRSITPQQLTDLNACLHRFDIVGPETAHFMAQCTVESGGFRWFMELADGWVYDLSVNPEKAKSLGNFQIGDGPKYKGVGPIQTTGGNNIKRLGEFLHDPLCYQLGSHYVAQHYAFTASGFWWQNNKMKSIILNHATASQVSRQVNRGNWLSNQPANHEAQRIASYKIAKSLWP
jgi:predicted chitinase